MSIELKKPPIVEAWIGFNFEPAPNTTGWDKAGLERVTQFLREHASEFPEQEQFRQESFTVEKRTPDGLPKQGRAESQVVFFRAIDQAKSRAVQIGTNVLSYHLLRASDSYPGFRKLRDDSLDELRCYSERFNPQALTQIELHMIDLVAIPRPSNTNCQIEDYFAISLNIPSEPFGALDDFSIRLQLRGATQEDRLHLHFHLLRAGSNETEFRFRIKWDMACPVQMSVADRSQISARLDSAYQHLFNCFQSMFTERGWKLFEPVEATSQCS